MWGVRDGLFFLGEGAVTELSARGVGLFVEPHHSDALDRALALQVCGEWQGVDDHLAGGR